MPMSHLQVLMRQGPGNFTSKTDHPATLKPSRITLDPEHLVHPNEPPISDLLYAGFLEHLGRCIYGGIVDDSKNPSPANLLVQQDNGQNIAKGRAGWRKDVMEVIGKKGELEVPMLRWPGGNFVSNYHWQDGIGPIENRPRRIELAWLSDESNQFGTDEFIDYCRGSGCEPYLCLNMGTGTYEEALAWLEYCNGTGNTYWANLRRKNTGRHEPHAVKYWGLGNEMWGPWQVGHLTQTDYAVRTKTWAHGLKLVDPTIKLISCGNTGCTDWDREVLQELIDVADYHSIHFYSMLGHQQLSSVPGLEYEKNVFGATAAEKMIEVCKSLIDLANVERSMQKIPARDVKICFDEWNVWDEVKAPGASGLEQTYDFVDMLGFCGWLHVLVRKHKDVGIACLAQTVNVISPLMTRPDGMLYQTTFYPLKTFSTKMKNGYLLQVPTPHDCYEGPTYPTWIQQTAIKPTYIDIIAVLVKTDTGSSIRISVINRHPEADWTMSLTFAGFKVLSAKAIEMYSDDMAAANTFESPKEVIPSERSTGPELVSSSKSDFTVKKHSWYFLEVDGETIA